MSQLVVVVVVHLSALAYTYYGTVPQRQAWTCFAWSWTAMVGARFSVPIKVLTHSHLLGIAYLRDSSCSSVDLMDHDGCSMTIRVVLLDYR